MTLKHTPGGLPDCIPVEGTVRVIPCDIVIQAVGQGADLDAIVEAAVERFGRLDVYVANAGINDSNKTHFLEITPDQYDRIMDVNLKGMFFTAQACARHMVEHGTGRIIAISSQASVVGIREHVAYSASKGGVNQMVRVLALEWGPYGIRINSIAPGPIADTEGMRRLAPNEAIANQYKKSVPLQRFGAAEEIGQAAMFLSSEAA